MENHLGGFGERSQGLDSWPSEAFIYLLTDLFYEPHSLGACSFYSGQVCKDLEQSSSTHGCWDPRWPCKQLGPLGRCKDGEV